MYQEKLNLIEVTTSMATILSIRIKPLHTKHRHHTPTPWTSRSVCDISNSRKHVKTQQNKSLETVANTTRKIHARTLHRRRSNACLATRLHMTRAVVLGQRLAPIDLQDILDGCHITEITLTCYRLSGAGCVRAYSHNCSNGPGDGDCSRRQV